MTLKIDPNAPAHTNIYYQIKNGDLRIFELDVHGSSRSGSWSYVARNIATHALTAQTINDSGGLTPLELNIKMEPYSLSLKLVKRGIPMTKSDVCALEAGIEKFIDSLYVGVDVDGYI